MDKDFHILKQLKSIKPDPEYARRSKMLVLATPQNQIQKKISLLKNFFEVLRFSVVFGLGILLMTSMLGGISYINKNFSPLSLEGLNQKSLSVEAEDINRSIQITLEEIKYLDQSNQKTIKVINEVSKNKPVYSSASSTGSITTAATSTIGDIANFLIESPTSTSSNNIDKLLDKAAE